MPNPFFSGRIPKDLDERIKQHINETGESKTDILINALSAHLNYPITPRSNSTNEVSKEMFAALEERVAMLEKLFQSFDNEIINLDNNKKDVAEEKPEQLNIIDNKTDTHNDNKDTESNLVATNDNPDNTDEYFVIIASSNNNENTSNGTDNTTDNEADNYQLEVSQPQELLPRPQRTLVKLENLTSGEMVKASGIRQTQLDGYRKRIVTKYQKANQALEENQLLNPAEKIETKKPLIINGYPYDLFYLGQNEKGKNLWTALPFDNNRYQQLSINSMQEES